MITVELQVPEDDSVDYRTAATLHVRDDGTWALTRAAADRPADERVRSGPGSDDHARAGPGRLGPQSAHNVEGQ